MAKKRGGSAAGLVLGIAGAAALAAVGTTAAALWKWSKDPDSTVFWCGLLPGGRGIRVVKGSEAHNYEVQTGYRWCDDVPMDELVEQDEPEIEIPLPEDLGAVPEGGNEA